MPNSGADSAERAREGWHGTDAPGVGLGARMEPLDQQPLESTETLENWAARQRQKDKQGGNQREAETQGGRKAGGQSETIP